jgi:hypothetical protein
MVRVSDSVLVVKRDVQMQDHMALGFNDEAHLDDGAMWPTSFALTQLTATDEERIGALVQQAVR